eukprot:COSAG01_NODE_7558_length_3150_cov_3.446411_3_plen_41_part_00
MLSVGPGGFDAGTRADEVRPPNTNVDKSEPVGDVPAAPGA